MHGQHSKWSSIRTSNACTIKRKRKIKCQNVPEVRSGYFVKGKVVVPFVEVEAESFSFGQSWQQVLFKISGGHVQVQTLRVHLASVWLPHPNFSGGESSLLVRAGAWTSPWPWLSMLEVRCTIFSPDWCIPGFWHSCISISAVALDNLTLLWEFFVLVLLSQIKLCPSAWVIFFFQ